MCVCVSVCVHTPEEGLQVLRQFRPASIAWIHCDEETNSRRQLDLTSFKPETLLLVPEREHKF